MDENNASGLPFSQNGMPLSQNGMPLTNTTFTTKEIEGLIQDRKRYLVANFITAGIPLTTTYNDHPQGLIPEETATASTYQTSMKTQETTTFAYQTAGGRTASMNNPQSEVGCHLFVVRNLRIDLFTSAARLATDKAVKLITVQPVMPKPSTDGLAKPSASR